MTGLIIDNFAGGGGASTGIEAALGRPVDIAINHDPLAIQMHKANHPHTLHLTEDLFDIEPHKVCRGRDVDLAWFSPDCTHFSKAKGGSVKRDRRIRGLAWVAVKWAAQVQPAVICLENVEEFQTWGPLTKSGKPNKKRQGEYFWKFIDALHNHGYEVEWRELVASNYGSPTSRKRFFLIARCDGEPIVYPEPTHGPGRAPYRTAAECIDWTIPTVSIFATPEECAALGIKAKRPLAENTMKRIARGVWKFILESNNPYILNDEQTAAFMSYHYTGHDGYDVRDPLKTITARDHHALVAAMLTKYHGAKADEARGQNPRDPLATVDTSNRFGIVTANLITIDRTDSDPNNRVHKLDRPMRTITLRNNHALVASYLTKFKGDNIGASIREPVQTITAGGLHHAQVAAFLVKYYGQGTGQKLSDPLATITSHDTFGLVTVHGEQYQIADIGMRMLKPHELKLAQGFPAGYILTGPQDSQVARIGNSVPPQLAEAIVRANVAPYYNKESLAA